MKRSDETFFEGSPKKNSKTLRNMSSLTYVQDDKYYVKRACALVIAARRDSPPMNNSFFMLFQIMIKKKAYTP